MLFRKEAVGRVCLKERGRDVLVLQRVSSTVTSPSDRPSPTSSGGGAREEDGDRRNSRFSRCVRRRHGVQTFSCAGGDLTDATPLPQLG
ncbi:unnamed protein product [Boreogadus saida]